MSKTKFKKTTITVEVIHNGNLKTFDPSLIQTENMLGYLVDTSIPSGDIVAATLKVKSKSKSIAAKLVEKFFGSKIKDLV